MSLAVLADHMASKGRGPDSMLIHMSPREVQGLQSLAVAHGGSLTVNPETGLPEAGILDKLLPAILGFALAPMTAGTSLAFLGATPMASALTVGGLQTLRTGDLGKGISAGLGAYGGAGLGASLATAGGNILSGEATALAAEQAGNLAAEQASQLGVSDAIKEQMIDEASQATARVATDATPFERISAGAKAAATNPSSLLTKDNFKYLAAGAAPILADQAVKSNLPTTATKPGMIRPYSFDPYGGTYTAGTPYEAQAKKAAGGGLMGLAAGGMASYGDGDDVSRRTNDGMAQGGMYDFTQRSEPVVRMAEGGIAGYANGALVSDKQIFDYFAAPGAKTDAQIAADMQTYNVSAADIARATGTQGQQGNYEQRFVNAIATPGITADQFNAYTADVGLTGQNLATALQNSGLSQSAQYALTHNLNDIAGIGTAPKSAQDFYNTFGYQAGDLRGDVGGLAGMYTNINQVAGNLQNLIDSGKLTVQQAQNMSLAEMERLGINQKDIKNATGVDFANLFKPKEEKKVVTPITTVAGTTIIPGINDYGLGGTGTSGRLESVYGPALPPGVSGAGITTVNPNGTITTRPNIPGIPEGGFTGMTSLRDAYTKGGGSLGYIPYAPKTIDEFNTKYNKLTGGSKAALDYLMGKTPYSPTPYTPTGEIMKPYFESVGRFPENRKAKKYVFVNGKYELNPDYVKPSYVLAGEKAAADKAAAETTKAGVDAGKTINVLDKEGQTEVATLRSDGKYYTSGGDTYDEYGKRIAADGGLMAMARGGMSQQFNLGDYSDGGRLLRGPGDGVSDSIPATIGNKRPARLADGEFVVPARIVSELGNGSTEAGARKLYAMMDRVQKARRNTVGKGKVAKNSRSDKYLPA